MNNASLILDGMYDPKMEQALETPLLGTFTREINHKYGLKVFTVSRSGGAIYMATPTGLPICYLSMGDDADKPQYSLYTPWYSKARGNSNTDRHTMRSTKLSTLMTSLKKVGVIEKAMECMVNRYSDQILSTKNIVSRQVGGSETKSVYGLPAEDIHDLLKAALSDNPATEIRKLNLNSLNKVLKEYDEVDETRRKKKIEIDRMFSGACHVIGIDGSGEYIVGTFKFHPDNGPLKGDVIRPFKRMKNILDCGIDDLIPTLLMFKTMASTVELDSITKVGNDVVFPVKDHYYEELEMAFYYPSSPNSWNLQWVVTPASE